MSAESCVGGGRATSKEKELAIEALALFSKGDYSGCLGSLERLEVLRPSDVKLAHNKIVAQCRADGSPVSLSEVVQQLDGLAKTAGIDLSGPRREDEPEWGVLTYNLALAKFQQRHILQASQLASRLVPLSPQTAPGFAKKVLFLNAELSLALRQPELALRHAAPLEALIEGGNESEAARLMILKARCLVMARQIKALKKELKSVNLPGTLGVTSEFCRSHIEFQCGNYRKSIKMLNSAVQAGGARVFPHYYNNLGCLHQNMKKPNLAVYYFKNALERLESTPGGTLVPSPSDGGKESTSWITQAQVLYNISLSLLHAGRPQLAFELLLEVVASHYLDPHVWFHLAECCVHHLHPAAERQYSPANCSGIGSGLSHKMVAASPAPEVTSTAAAPGSLPVLSLDFAYVCLKNADSLLPQTETENENGGFCGGVGYIGNPLSWNQVEQLRTALLAAKSFVALAVGDFVLGGRFAEELLAMRNLPAGYRLLGHLYAAESCILQDKISEAINHLDPENISDVGFGFGLSSPPSPDAGSTTMSGSVADSRSVLQYNLAVSFALREEWDKASSLAGSLYERSREVSMHVLLLNLYLALRQGRTERARQLMRERCPLIRLEAET